MSDHVPLGRILHLDLEITKTSPSGKYPMAGVNSFGRGLFHRNAIDGAITSYKRLHRLRARKLVISRLFAFEGALAVVPEEFDGAFVSPEFPTFSIDLEKADTRYVGFLCQWSSLWQELAAIARGVGVRRRRVYVEDVLQVKVPLPALEEQRRIATVLSRVARSTSVAVARLVHADECFKHTISALVHRPDLDLGAKVAQGWEQVTMSDMVRAADRQERVSAESTYRVAGLYSYGRGFIDRGPIKGADTTYKQLSRLCQGDLVFSKLNGWEGALAIVGEDFAGHYVSSEYPTFTLHRDDVVDGYIAALISTPEFWKALDDATRGSMVRRRRIHPSAFLATRVWRPPLSYQERVSDVAAELRGLVGVSQRGAWLEAVPSAALNRTFGPLASG